MTHPADSVPSHKLSVSLFGSFHLTISGEPVRVPRARAASWILALLILRRGGEVDRHWLSETLWTHAEEASALFNLRRNLSELRKMLGSESGRVQSPTPRTLRFDFTGVDCDLIEFERLTKRSDYASLKSAVDLYRGELLEGCREEWVLPERTRLEQNYLRTLENLAQHETESGNLHEATQWLKRATLKDPLCERTRCCLMETLWKIGDFAGVEHQYRELRRLLRNELNLEPTAETIALYGSLRTQAHSPTSSLSPPTSLPSSAVAFNNLPSPLTSLIGREEETRRVGLTLKTARIVTLVGPGGVGKTRLSLTVAEAEIENYPAGICFVDLSSAKTDGEVPQAVIAALNLQIDANITPGEALHRFLQPRHFLLILDNGEHIIEACALLAGQLLRTCPSLTILCTSRQPLSLAGEIIIPVLPLGVPEETQHYNNTTGYVASLTLCESVILLLDRVRSSVPEFCLTLDNAFAIAHICRCLDGLPLALELVAARFRALSVTEIAARLDTKLRLLSGGDPALPRHRTLHATLDWSYDLLSVEEKRLLRHLSVFRGGWTLEAAEKICPSVGKETVSVLISLVDKSLVVYEPRMEQDRYRLLEMTRQYVVERLDAQEQSALEESHAVFFYNMTRSECPPTQAFHQNGVLVFRAERDNFRAAHAWYQNHNADDALWLEFFLYTNKVWSLDNLEEWVIRLQETPMPPTLLGLYVTRCVATLALWNGHPAHEPLLHHLLALACLCEERFYEMDALGMLSDMEEDREDLSKSLAYLERAIKIAKRNGDTLYVTGLTAKAAIKTAQIGKVDMAINRMQGQLQEGKQSSDFRLIGTALYSLGVILYKQGDYTKARLYWNESLPLVEQFLPGYLPDLWRQLGWVALEQKDYTEAYRCLEKAVVASQENLAIDREGWTRWDIAEVSFQEGNPEKAVANLKEAILLFQSSYEPRSVAQCLIKLAKFCIGWKQYSRAATLLSGAKRAFEEFHFTISAKERKSQENLSVQLCQLLDTEAWEIHSELGKQMTLDQCIAFAFSHE